MMKCCITTFALVLSGGSALASMQLDLLFGDHAVLQREAVVPVWGRGAVPGREVRVSCGASVGVTTVQADGSFRALLAAQAAGGPYELVATSGGERVVSTDVYIGEVWLASGQSNMAFLMKDAIPAFPAGDHPKIRMFNIPQAAGIGRVRALASGSWQQATSENVPEFSAVAGFFALELQRRLGCAVGILHSSWGGTRIESWTSREALLTDEVVRPWVVAYERSLCDPELPAKVAAVHRSNAERRAKVPLDDGISAVAKDWGAGAESDGWREVSVPSTFELAYGRELNGAVWFRRTVELPPDFVGKDLVLHIGAVDKHDRTFFNGVQVGGMGKGLEFDSWDKLRVYPVPGSLVRGGAVTVAVRVWSFIYAGGMNGPEGELFIALKSDPERRVSIAGRWFSRIEREIKDRFVYTPAPLTSSSPYAPYTLFNSMIEPLVGYGIRGVIWYQGCSNAGKAENDFHYGKLAELLIRDWRYRWGQGDFPFVQVELANYRQPAVCEPQSGFAIVRQGQREATRALENVGLASAVDVGAAHDIHPKDKRTVGNRLARWAFANVYGLETVGCGPRIVSSSIEGNCVRVRFSDCGSGLVAKGSPEGIVKPCAISGDDGVFHPAVGRLDGNTLVIRSDEVKSPKRACYGFASNPLGLNLYNSEGLPASPFMTY